jgi:hypothetical protein
MKQVFVEHSAFKELPDFLKPDVSLLFMEHSVSGYCSKAPHSCLNLHKVPF